MHCLLLRVSTTDAQGCSADAQVHRYRHMKPGRVLLHGALHRCASSLPLCITSSCERSQPTPRGADAQRRLSKSHILVSGLKGTAVEFCKNIVFAGVGNQNIYSGKSFAELCSDSLKDFNPMVRVSVEKGGKRMLSKSHILVSGLKGIAVEFCKNIVLAGVGSVILNIVTEELLSANFFIPPDQNIYSGKSFAELCSDSLKDFNPMVRVSVEKGGKPFTLLVYFINLLLFDLKTFLKRGC
ncbi:hypothetical protein ACS0TY_024931 [Phlomoides rotata]